MEDENLNKLIEIYKNENICVFTGAGVSLTKAESYESLGWDGLLEEIFEQGKKESAAPDEWGEYASFKENAPNAWTFADKLIELLGDDDKFQELITETLIRRTGGDSVHKRLPVDYLKKADTLSALVTFCGEIKDINTYHCVKRNDKVKAVMTLNYDWYLEGGATQKFNALPLKPMVDHDSQFIPNKIPVYHLHAYIPHDKTKKKRRDLVMSSASYREAYKSDNSWVCSVLDQFIPAFTTIFVGVSFKDELLMEHLHHLAESSDRAHFFFGKKSEFTDDKVTELEEVKVYPIWVSNFPKIADFLKKVYMAGLPAEKLEVRFRKTGETKFYNRNEYWETLNSIKK